MYSRQIPFIIYALHYIYTLILIRALHYIYTLILIRALHYINFVTKLNATFSHQCITYQILYCNKMENKTYNVPHCRNNSKIPHCRNSSKFQSKNKMYKEVKNEKCIRGKIDTLSNT
jgi:hypothetical protein